MTEIYRDGTITVTSGSFDFVGTGTAWLPSNVKRGDVVNVDGHMVAIDELTDATHGKFVIPYPGVDGAGVAYAVLKTSSEYGTNRTLSVDTAEMIRLLTTISVANTGIAIDSFGPFAGRSTYDAKPMGFSYLSLDGDGALITTPVAFLKHTVASADWSAAIPISGVKGDPGEKGWSPIFAMESVGARRVWKLTGYVGGAGDAPTANIGKYVGPGGYVTDIAEATDQRGVTGARGWSPVLSIVADGARRVRRLVGYVGGEGDEPIANVGKYIGLDGYVTDIADATDERGATGATGAAGEPLVCTVQATAGIAAGTYPFTRYYPGAASFGHIFASVLGGAGSVVVYVHRNGAAVYGPVTVNGSGADISLAAVGLALVKGDKLDLVVSAPTGSVTYLLVQLDGSA